ncbi:AraC family transcriptional regulator [Paenibacillus germinis]|uniref:AraC family transcriptional regulator n=1 Tax=Paenibacillus germinis TaxID=2654979 RepID=UPI001492CD39|nr:AraC family transcriptional regulator [Paenibacillus germinis]
MKLKSFQKKKFFNGIYLWITAAICFLVIGFSATIYYNVRKNVVENNYELNKQMLYQMKYNITYMNETVRHLISSIYFSSDADYLLHVKETDSNIFDLNLTLNKMTTSVINNNPLIHSIYLYNNEAKTFLSTYNGMFYQDEELKDTLNSYKTLPILQPISRKMKMDGKSAEVFTYAMYKSPSVNGVYDAAVFVNVNADLVINNIKTINATDMKGDLFLLSDKRQVVNSDLSTKSLQEPVKQLFASKIEENIKQGQQYGYMIDKILGENYFITYMYIEGADWVLIKTQPLSDVLRYMNKIQLSILIMTLIFLALSILISFALSKQIYRPIGNLVQRMSSGRFGSNENNSTIHHDEIGFLNQTYTRIVELVQTAQSKEQENVNQLKNYYLRNLLIDSVSMQEKELLSLKEHSEITLSSDGTFIVCVMKIDNYQLFKENNTAKDIELYKYSIANIASETISKAFANESLDMKRDHFAIIIHSKVLDKDEIYQELYNCLSELQGNISKYLGLSLSISIGIAVDKVNHLSQSYNVALINSNYRYVFGKSAIITLDMIEQQNQIKELHYSVNLEKKLVDEMKSLNVNAAEDTIFAILKEISQQSGSHIPFSIMQLIRTIMATIFEMNDTNINQPVIDFNEIYGSVMTLETIDEIYDEMKSLLRRLISTEKYQSHQKHIAIAQAIKDTIEKNYSDPDLSLQKLGSIYKMSSSYVGQIFKGQVGMSVASYINDVRILSAKELLETSQLTVSQVMEKVGIPNETSFYRLFKKKFGSSPKEYVLMKAIKEN